MESHGALVGWTHRSAGDHLMLSVESVRSKAAADRHDPDIFRFLMTKQQAAVLGNYLIELSGQSASDPKDRSWFRRFFG